jgi:hypothetical protein
MQWRVELKLRPGSNLLEPHVALYNRDDVRHIQQYRLYRRDAQGQVVKQSDSLMN